MFVHMDNFHMIAAIYRCLHLAETLKSGSCQLVSHIECLCSSAVYSNDQTNLIYTFDAVLKVLSLCLFVRPTVGLNRQRRRY